MKPPVLHHENLPWLLKQPTDITLSMLENHLDICRLLVNEILEEEVIALCGERYAHQKPHNVATATILAQYALVNTA